MHPIIRVALPALFAIAGVGQPAIATDHHARIILPLATAADVVDSESEALLLHVSGDAGGFDVEVTSRRPLPDCAHNLVHWSSHGPDPSEVLPWQVVSMHFPDTRWIPVCGSPLTLEVSIASAEVDGTGGDAKFTAGTLRVSIADRHPHRARTGR